MEIIMDTPICYIFGAGEFAPCEITLTENDLVIAADGGYDHLIGLGLRADIALGDFDSVRSTIPTPTFRHWRFSPPARRREFYIMKIMYSRSFRTAALR